MPRYGVSPGYRPPFKIEGVPASDGYRGKPTPGSPVPAKPVPGTAMPGTPPNPGSTPSAPAYPSVGRSAGSPALAAAAELSAEIASLLLRAHSVNPSTMPSPYFSVLIPTSRKY